MCLQYSMIHVPIAVVLDQHVGTYMLIIQYEQLLFSVYFLTGTMTSYT